MNKTFKIFKALADETRLKIAVYLSKHKEVSCQELSKNFKLSQPTLSHHYSKLEAAGIMLVRKEGVGHFYRINHEQLKEAGVDLKSIK
jgi:ArsR family transcriptional regulator